jgi:hypothetical protein
MVTALRLEGLNGDVRRRKAKHCGPRAKGQPRRRGKALRHARRLALLTGGVGAGVLSLSIAHCTESIALLTGSHWTLAELLAVGIDAGMVASKLVELACQGTRADAGVKP